MNGEDTGRDRGRDSSQKERHTAHGGDDRVNVFLSPPVSWCIDTEAAEGREYERLATRR